MGKVAADLNIASVLNRSKPYGGWDTKVDDWMDANGKILGMINQSVFFNAACTKMLRDIVPDPHDSESAEACAALMSLINVKTTTLEHLASVASNLQINLLFSKRDEILTRTDLAEEYKQTLRFATP